MFLKGLKFFLTGAVVLGVLSKALGLKGSMSRRPCVFQPIMGGRRGARRDRMINHRTFQEIYLGCPFTWSVKIDI